MGQLVGNTSGFPPPQLAPQGALPAAMASGPANPGTGGDPAAGGVIPPALDPSQLSPAAQNAPQQVPTDPSQQPPAATAPVVGPPADSQNAPPQADVNAYQANIPPPPQTKGQKLLQLLQAGITGALSGQQASVDYSAKTGRSGGFGVGLGGGFTQQLPFLRGLQGQQLQRGGLENQLLSGQAQFAPYQRYLDLLRGGADIRKTGAQADEATANAGKATAEAGAIPIKSQLEQAQTEAANYKEDPNVGLIDLRTKQPVSSGGMAILDAPSAVVLGKQAGERVPLKVATQAKALSDQGVSYTQAGGHNWLVDKQGNKLKDMGTATPVAVNNIQNSGATGTPGQPSALSQAIANGSMKWSDAVSSRTPMSVKSAILSEVKGINPSFNSGDFDVEQAVKTQATSGAVGQQLLAIGTAREHMKVFSQLADALDNNDSQLANKIGNAVGIQFGSDKATNLAIASQAFGGEVGRAFDGAGVIGKEREQASSAYANYLSKGQFAGAVKTVDQLLAGKQKAAHAWFDQGVQAKPDFGQSQSSTPAGNTAGPPPGASHAVVVNGKTVGYTSDGRTMTPAP
jgi:hypothetical protein